jgi:Zn-dependent protease
MTLRCFGIPLRIDPSWFLVVGLLSWTLSRGYFPSEAPGFGAGAYWVMGLAAALLLFACVLLHELGHALTARAFGIPVSGMTLFIFGGVAHIAKEASRPWIELCITLAGPLVSFALVWVCRWAAQALAATAAAAALLQYLSAINTGLLLFNLLPGFPLDGGRVLRAVIWWWTGNWVRATRVASVLGSLLGFGLIAMGAWIGVRGHWSNGVWYVLLGLFLRNAASSAIDFRRQTPDNKLDV